MSEELVYHQPTLALDELDPFAESKSFRTRLSEQANRVGRFAGRVAFCAGLGLLGSSLLATSDAEVGPVDVSVSTKLELDFSGDTGLDARPFGDTTWQTHDGLIGVNTSLMSVDGEKLNEISQNPDSLDSLRSDVANELGNSRNELAVKFLGYLTLGSVAGAAGGVLFWSDKRSFEGFKSTSKDMLGKWAASSLASTVIVAGLAVAPAFLTYDEEAVNNPEFSGLLEELPEALQDIPELTENYESYTDQLAEMIIYLGRYREAISQAEVLPSTDDERYARVLVLSDEHCQPGTHELEKSIVESEGVDFILRAGDLTDFGSEAENDCFEQGIEATAVPNFVIIGNHDGEPTEGALQEIPNVTLLLPDGYVYQDGLWIAGVPDTRNTPSDLTRAATPKEELIDQDKAVLLEIADPLLEKINASSTKPDIVVLPDAKLTNAFTDSAPLVVVGGKHKASFESSEESTILYAGSIGGGGLRAFDNGKQTDRTAELMIIDKTTGQPVNVVRYNFGTVASGTTTIQVCAIEEREPVCV